MAVNSGTGNVSTAVSLLPGSTVTFTVVAQISATATGDLINTVTVTPPAGATDVNPGNNTATDIDTYQTRITGTKYKDLTGNGLSVDDTPLGGVVINLYTDANNNGVRDSGDGPAVATTTTNAVNGTYSFNVDTNGRYFAEEIVPSGWVRTSPTFNDYNTVIVAAQTNYFGNNFANFEKCDLSDITGVSYLINGSTTVTDLRGNVNQGDTVQVRFTVIAGATPHRFSFVSYTAPSATFIASEASQQQEFDSATGVFGPGTYTMSVVVPNCYFQIDFVCGDILAPLGPEGSNIFYTPQGRLISADNDGTQACALASLSGYVYVDANNNGVKNTGEIAIASVTVTLTGTDIYGVAVSRSTTTNSSGYYVFSGLKASNAAGYKLTETQPASYLDGKDAIGSQGGTTGNDMLTTAFLNTNISGFDNNFGELPLNYTKFYVVNSATTDRTYEYKPDGSLVESYTINSGNTEPRGIATTVAGDKVWVVDANRKVYVYNTSGGLLGSWTAGSLPTGAVVEDITTNGTDVWIVDAFSDKVYKYAGAASTLSGTVTAASNFALNTANKNPKGLVTDGTSIWVVNDSTTDTVFKYSVTGTCLGSWTIAAANSAPTGITINPADVSDIWIVDSTGCKIYQYTAAATRVTGSQSSASVFALAAGNTCAQGIADPPPQEMSSAVVGQKTEATPVASMGTRILNRVASLLTPVARKKADVVSSNLQREEVSRLPVAVRGDLPAAGIRNRRTQQRTGAQLPATQTWSESLASEPAGFEQLDAVDGLFSDWTADPLELLGVSGTH